ncbi:hypothetical protein [Kordia sp.]|uniref:hypothetical protein n=1 Tax=Kordia sp. TaxID=1965332 RepID=UPI003D2B8D72
MSQSDTVCKKMSQDDYLKMIENNPILKEKLDEIGISENEDGLAVRLMYSDILTEEEKKFLRQESPIYFEKGFFVKFGKSEDEDSVCFTDKICDRCYVNLLKRRERLQNE